MKKVLLIGGSSAIGQGILPFFENYNVTSCDSTTMRLPWLSTNEEYDIVINLAGVSVLCDLSHRHAKNESLISVNCLGAVNILAEFLPGMREEKYGRFIFFSSVCSEINLPLHGVYSASKAFVDKLVKIAAIENAQYGITVNSIQLGYTGIGMDGEPEKSINKPALKRFVTMKEIFETIEYIINTEYLTGQNIRLDGGIK